MASHWVGILTCNSYNNCYTATKHIDPHLGPIHAPQLAPVVVPPAVDGPGAAPGQGPVLGLPVEPHQQLLVVTSLEDGVALVVQAEGLVIRNHFDNLLPDLNTKCLR